jgi:hypothetical protein
MNMADLMTLRAAVANTCKPKQYFVQQVCNTFVFGKVLAMFSDIGKVPFSVFNSVQLNMTVIPPDVTAIRRNFVNNILNHKNRELHMAGLYTRSISAKVMTNGYHTAISKIMLYRLMLRADFTTVNREQLQFGSGS